MAGARLAALAVVDDAAARPRHQRLSEGGFTLIEVIVGFVLIALIVTMLTFGLRTAARSAAAADDMVERATELRIAQGVSRAARRGLSALHHRLRDRRSWPEVMVATGSERHVRPRAAADHAQVPSSMSTRTPDKEGMSSWLN